MKEYKIIKGIIFAIIFVLISVIAIIFTCDLLVVRSASGKTYSNVESCPHNRVGLLLAMSPNTSGDIRNFYFDNRIKAAEELYKAGKLM